MERRVSYFSAPLQRVSAEDIGLLQRPLPWAGRKHGLADAEIRQWSAERLAVKLDVMNILKQRRVTEFDEVGELAPDQQAPNYGLPQFFQAARDVRLSLSCDW